MRIPRALFPVLLTGAVAGCDAVAPNGAPQVWFIEVTPGAVAPAISDTVRLRAVVWYTDHTRLESPPVRWSSDAGQVATVSAGGLVTGVSSGDATVEAEFQGVTAVATVTVR